MTNKCLKTSLLAATIIAVLGAGAAAAAQPKDASDDTTEFAKLSGTKISLSEAIATAEQKFGGKAVNAALDNEQSSATFEVELMSASGSHVVSVDGLTGVAKIADEASDNGQDEGDTE